MKSLINKVFSPQKWFEYMRQIMVFGQYRGGQLIGMDRLGNRYYEIKDEKKMFPFRNRYVEYSNDNLKDASQVPAEWHGWLHSIVDDPPTKVEYSQSIAYSGHIENLTGTDRKYVPLNTTEAKIKEFSSESFQGSLADRIRNQFKDDDDKTKDIR